MTTARSSHARAPSSGAFAFFINMKVKTKILSGFAGILAVLAVVGGVGYFSLERVSDTFDTYAQETTVLAATDDVNMKFATLRRYAREAVITGNAEHERKAQVANAEVKKSLEEALKVTKALELIKKLQEVQEWSTAYWAIFAKAMETKKAEHALTTGTLDPTGLKLRQDFDALATIAARAGNSTTQLLALGGLETLMVARLDVNKALARHDAATRAKAEASFNELRQTLKGIESAARSPELKPVYEEVKVLTDKYYEAFHKVAELSEEIEKLLNGEMAKDGQAVADAAEAIKHSVAEDQKAGLEEMHAVAGSAETMSVVLVFLGLLLGVAFALLIGRAIASPVVAMTDAMKTLAGGDKTVTIPAVGRKDEVGLMAGAVQVFKENMIRAEQLAEEQKKEQEARNRRTELVSSLTQDFDAKVGDVLTGVSSASTQLQTTAGSMSATAEETSKQASAVASASEQASANVQTVASAAEELSSSIAEISRQVGQSSKIATQAVADAQKANEMVQGLVGASQKIGDVVALITDIAEQTNLLALNATIEAARAGEAGKGFAVVAAEVKNLANQTAKATDEIGGQITGIQSATQDAVKAIETIGKTIAEINEIASAIAAAVEEQGAATQEIARNVEQAAVGTQEVSSNITGVNQAANDTGSAAGQVLSAAQGLSRQSGEMKSLVESFLNQMRAA